ncbi:hypothetical protein CRYUN_Cryun07bG0050800 [Craigia yunnanensis]
MADPKPCNKKLEGKVAIITGGASGIGEATLHLFVDHGARAIVIADIQDEKGEQLAASIGHNCACTYVHCDVTEEKDVESLVQSTIKLYGGVAASIKHARCAMVEANTKGSIICTASIAAGIGSDRHTDYVMSKNAVLALMRCASTQLGAHGIRVNCVSPGPVATPLLCESFGMEVEEIETSFVRFYYLKYNGVLKVKHVADAVLFLASEESQFITGHNLVVDGGFGHSPS